MNTMQRYGALIVAAWGCLLFIPFLGAVHLFDWDEINFAESAREMIVTGNYQQVQINYQPFTEKPPLFFWIQVLSMKIFGVNEFAARFPNAVVGVITLVFIFSIAKKHFNYQLGFIWVLMVTGSFTPHLYFKSGIIDPLYNLFIFASIWQLFRYTLAVKVKHAILLGIFTGLAVITKGPVAIIIVLLCFVVLWALKRFEVFFKWKHIFYTVLMAFMVCAVWFGVETIKRGPGFLLEFLKYQADLFLNPVAGHGQPFWYHPLVLLCGCFPASVFGVGYLFKRQKPVDELTGFFQLMQVMFWVVLILFSIVETKIVHYSSLCYLPLTFIAAYFIYEVITAHAKLVKSMQVLLLVLGSVIAFLFILLPLTDHFKAWLIPHIKDDFAVASLQVNGGWNGFEWLGGAAMLATVWSAFYLIRKFDPLKGTLLLLFFISLYIPVVLRIIAPRIEQYSQAPAIQFFESLQGKNCYIETLGYKSYAPYFYGKTLPPENKRASEINWLLGDSIDKDVYFAVHVNNIPEIVRTQMQEIRRQGGFAFYLHKATR